MKPAVVLTLDTSSATTLSVSLKTPKGTYEKNEETGNKRSLRLLPLCTELLYEHRLSWADLTDICVVNKEGSITGLRVGFAVANALGFLLGIPVNGMKAIENIHPQYGTVTYLDTLQTSPPKP